MTDQEFMESLIYYQELEKLVVEFLEKYTELQLSTTNTIVSSEDINKLVKHIHEYYIKE